ncbi:Imm63 family immunity protein [Pseudomonas sp. QE6]|uniref:Imm63 family immunity protein n=1 Tax=Pseudomonas sp. QE6 TaxID=3242491 RepID=UPI00352821C3
MSIQLINIQEKVYELGGRLNAPRTLLVVHDKSVDDGTPYVRIDNGVFHYISSERGYELFNKVAPSLDVLLYWILDRVVSRLAMDYELHHRVEGQDSRRIYFSKRIELMKEIDPRWGDMVGQDIERILQSNPYTD